MIKVKVTDPNKEISSIYVLHDTKDCVVLYVNLKKKYQGITSESETSFFLDEAEVKVSGLPFKEYEYRLFSEASRYTLIVTYVRKSLFEEMEELYPLV